MAEYERTMTKHIQNFDLHHKKREGVLAGKITATRKPHTPPPLLSTPHALSAYLSFYA